jgi:hypothetical protein
VIKKHDDFPLIRTVVVDSDHRMQTELPQVIIDAIQQRIAAQHK